MAFYNPSASGACCPLAHCQVHQRRAVAQARRCRAWSFAFTSPMTPRVHIDVFSTRRVSPRRGRRHFIAAAYIRTAARRLPWSCTNPTPGCEFGFCPPRSCLLTVHCYVPPYHYRKVSAFAHPLIRITMIGNNHRQPTATIDVRTRRTGRMWLCPTLKPRLSRLAQVAQRAEHSHHHRHQHRPSLHCRNGQVPMAARPATPNGPSMTPARSLPSFYSLIRAPACVSQCGC
jgi:hypothetical protein